MRRREFITLIGGAAAWPFTLHAQQQSERMRRIGVLFAGALDDPQTQTRLPVIQQELQKLGWTDGRNMRIDTRYGDGDTQVLRRQASELVALAPDVILSAGGNPTLAALQQANRTIPIVFAGVVDPVGAGFVASLARPGRQHHRLHAI